VESGKSVFERVNEIDGGNTAKPIESYVPPKNQKERHSYAELERGCERQMERSKKTDACFVHFAGRFAGNKLDATLEKIQRLIIDGRSGRKLHYTDDEAGEKSWLLSGAKETRSTWCTTCAAAEKCASFTLHVLAKREESPIRS